MGYDERLLHAKQIAKYLAEHGATVADSEKVLELCLAAIKESVVDVNCASKFEGWMA